MKALAHDRYGPPADVLSIEVAEVPIAAADEVLVRVHAASIHIGDCHGVMGVPYLLRPVYGLSGPKSRIPGTDIAGTVEAVGTDVTRFRPGDEVFGWCSGAFAESAVASEDALVPKPPEVSLEQAAATGVSAMVALQALRDYGDIRPGQHVLVNGASGGVGTFAVQTARSLGAEVTGVCSTRNVEVVRSIGADHVLDYTQEDFTQDEERYDLILDNVGTRSLSATRRALAPDGVLLSNGAPVGGWTRPIGRIIAVLVSSFFASQQSRPVVHESRPADLATLGELLQTGQIHPLIDRARPLAEAADAVGHVAQGHASGTTVILM